jgi:hypothetical protein
LLQQVIVWPSCRMGEPAWQELSADSGKNFTTIFLLKEIESGEGSS